MAKGRLSRQIAQKSADYSLDYDSGQVDGICENLSNRELEVRILVAEDFKNREIAQELHISNATVKTHWQHIFAKWGVSNRTAAVPQALA